VLIAAVALAAALVPLVLAYLQLGFHDDIGASNGADAPTQADRTLEQGLHNATVDIPNSSAWANRDDAVQRVKQRLESTIEAVNRSRLDAGQLLQVSSNQSRATDWVARNCPSGPDRQFGNCEASRGLIIQDRAGRTHVLAMAVDMQISTPESEMQLTVIIERE